MTQEQYIISRKVNILELGQKLGNISEACRKLGVSRQHFYDIKATIREEGIDGLIEKSRQKPRYQSTSSHLPTLTETTDWVAQLSAFCR
jgi:transposase